MNEFADALHRIGTVLGFAGTGIALAYIAFLFAALFCVIYGLFTWTTVRRFHHVRSSQRGGKAQGLILIRGQRVKKIRRPRRMRNARR